MSTTTQVLVTGAGSGIGRLTATLLHERGHHVVATTESIEQCDELTRAVPGLRVVKMDITTADVALIDGWKVDVVVNCAGLGQNGPLALVPLDRIRRVFEVNVFGTLSVIQRVVAGMTRRAQGRVIIVSSVAGLLTFPVFGPYTMSKFAVEAMGRTLREELAPQGIEVTLVNPGPFETGFNDRMADSMWEWFGSDADDARVRELREVTEAVKKDQLDPVDVAQLLVDLVEASSVESRYVIPTDIVEQYS